MIKNHLMTLYMIISRISDVCKYDLKSYNKFVRNWR